jgi:hypothetical protein
MIAYSYDHVSLREAKLTIKTKFLTQYHAQWLAVMSQT